MAEEQEKVTTEGNEDASLDFAAMLRNASPTMRRVVVYQGIILIVLAMVVVGSIAYKGVVLSLSDGPAEEEAPLRAETALPLDISAEGRPIQALQEGGAGDLNVRPEGAVLIRVERDGPVLTLHFRKGARDFIRVVNTKTGAIEAFDIP